MKDSPSIFTLAQLAATIYAQDPTHTPWSASAKALEIWRECEKVAKTSKPNAKGCAEYDFTPPPLQPQRR